MYRIIRRRSGLNTCPVCHDRDCPGCDYDDARAEAEWADWRDRLRDEQIA